MSFISSAWIVRRFLKDLSEIFKGDLMKFESWGRAKMKIPRTREYQYILVENIPKRIFIEL